MPKKRRTPKLAKVQLVTDRDLGRAIYETFLREIVRPPFGSGHLALEWMMRPPPTWDELNPWTKRTYVECARAVLRMAR